MVIHLNVKEIRHAAKLSRLSLAAILGKVLRFAVGVHICVHNRHLYLSVMESLLYSEDFCLQTLFWSLNIENVKQKNSLFH